MLAAEPSDETLAEREAALQAGEAALVAGQNTLREKEAHRRVVEERLLLDAQEQVAAFKVSSGRKRLWAQPQAPKPKQRPSLPPASFAARHMPVQPVPRQAPPHAPAPHAPVHALLSVPAGPPATPRKGYQARRAQAAARAL